MSEVEDYLNQHEIEFVHHDHPAVMNCAEAEKFCGDIPGIAGKNLFLKSKKGGRLFLVILPASKKMNLKKFEEIVGKKVSFGSAELMNEKLRLTPGSVSPFGLINDENGEVELFIDRDIYDADIVSFHPNVNTATLEIRREMFLKFLKTLKQKQEVIEL